MTKQLNIAHSRFNDQIGGLMICGYEWGYSKKDQGDDAKGVDNNINFDAGCTFANKDLCYGQKALGWRYDNNIIKWFGLWGHPLNREYPSAFEKSLVQTNWCDSLNPSMGGVDYFAKLTVPNQIDNFIYHVDYFRPRVIMFMGSVMIKTLQHKPVIERFESIMGPRINEPKPVLKSFTGRRFNIWLQSFNQCEVICLPHPSGSRGLSDAYIAMYKDNVGELLTRYKHEKF